MIGFTIFGSGQPAAIVLGPSSYQFYHRIIHLSRLILRRAFATKEARHENKSEKRGSKTSSGNVYHCSLIFHLIRLLVIYPFAGSLPLVYDSSVLLIPPSQFYFPMFRKTRLDIFGQHLFRERIRRVLEVSAPVEFNGASTYNLCHGWWPCFMIPRSVHSIPTMLANDQSHVDTIELP